MQIPEPFQVTAILVKIFERLQISYLLGGSMASSALGYERSTQDVDMVIVFTVADVSRLSEALEADFYADADMMLSAIETRSAFNIIHLPTMLKVDLFVSDGSLFAQSEMKRRQQLTLCDGAIPPVYIASAEDMILQKLRWYRMTGERSDRQWGDVQGMLRVQGDALDREYLNHWARELEIGDLLAQSLEDAGFSV
jgi:hypothetical protein